MNNESYQHLKLALDLIMQTLEEVEQKLNALITKKPVTIESKQALS